MDCETAVRQAAERARALSDAARTHTQQVAGLLIGLRPPASYSAAWAFIASKPRGARRATRRAKKLQFAYCPSFRSLDLTISWTCRLQG